MTPRSDKSPWNYGLAVVLAVSIYLLDIMLTHRVGFVDAGSAPYAVAVILVAAELGSLPAIITLATSVLLVAGATPLLFHFDLILAEPLQLSTIALETRSGIVLLVFASAWTVLRLRRHEQSETLLRGSNRELREQRDQARREADGLELSIRELYHRTATESAGVTVLYHQVQRMYSYDQAQTFAAILDALHQLTGAGQAVVYRFDEASLQLAPVSGWPSGSEKDYAAVDSADSIEGWVIRTNRLFSVRMLLNDDELRRIDRGGTVLAAPIHAFGRIWGVLTVHDMPFEKYNEFAELATQLVVALASPAVEQSLFKVMKAPEDEGEGGGPPVQNFSRFLPALAAAGREAAEAGRNVSLFVFEIREGEQLLQSFGIEAVHELMEEMGAAVASVSKGTAQVYRYERPYQLAAIISAIEYDAAGYMLLRVLESYSARAWTISGEAIFPDIIVGFSSTNQTMFQIDEMLNRVESMLSSQRFEPKESH